MKSSVPPHFLANRSPFTIMFSNREKPADSWFSQIFGHSQILALLSSQNHLQACLKYGGGYSGVDLLSLQRRQQKKRMPFLQCVLSSHIALWDFWPLLGVGTFSLQYRITPALRGLLYNTSSCQISLVYGTSAGPCAISLPWCKRQTLDSESCQSSVAPTTPKNHIALKPSYLLRDGKLKFTQNRFLISVFADRVTPSCM